MSVKEQPKRLGRGLAALLGDAAAPEAVSAPGVQNLAVDLLEPSPFQPRKEMDDDALGELAESIAQRGILQPLLVRPHPNVAGRFQIIAGERRWRAAQRVSLHEVPVLVRALTDSDAMAAGLVENLQREDLNAIEEAEGYQRLIGEFNMTQEVLGAAIGKSRAHIGNALRILRLPPEVLEMVRDGRLTMGHAKALLAHTEPTKGARLILKKDLSVRQAESYVNNLGRSIKPSAMRWPKHKNEANDGEITMIEADLSGRLGVRVTIKHKGTQGTVTVNYANLDQLDMILGRLNG
ncbi:MAG: ParB/RepB/Spo0J family partition protein [Acidocella sp.]|nr:ParB/RepB/Spo0J family partition protein [Acidocella sp.]